MILLNIKSKILNMKIFDFQKHPLRSGLALGFAAWLAVVLAIIGLILLIAIVEGATGGHGYDDLIGFMVIPVVALLAIPWYFVMNDMFTAIIVGCLINLMLIGLVIGLVKKFTSTKQDEADPTNIE